MTESVKSMENMATAQNVQAVIERIERVYTERERVFVAIDGPCTSGKTTLATVLQRRFGGNVLHMDDFFLRPEQRTAARYAQPGGNLDRERLESEILIPISRNKAAVYRPFNCRTLSLREPVTVLPGRLNIVEGSYSFTRNWPVITICPSFWTFPRKPSGAGY